MAQVTHRLQRKSPEGAPFKYSIPGWQVAQPALLTCLKNLDVGILNFTDG